MRAKAKKSSRGFSLLEALVAMGVGTLLVTVAAQMYTSAANATWVASQRAEMQQDLRAAENMMVKDISMAGTGLTVTPGGIGLVAGPGVVNAIYGCDQAQCYLPVASRAGVNFPLNPTPFFYWIIPGNGLGAQVFAGQGNTDAITVTYADMQFALQCYNVTFPSSTQATFTIQSPLTAGCQSPPLPQAVQSVSDPAWGLKAGDFVLFTNSAGGQAIGEVTINANGAASPFTVTFANPDNARMNQPSATATGSLQQMMGQPGTTAVRLLAITYYIDNSTGVPTLMRQVNGQTPVPLAENVVDLRITYDTYDANGNFTPSVLSPVPGTINTIRKVNIVHLTARSPLQGANKGYQSLDVQTSVSLRNMSFQNRYAIN